MDNPTGLLGNLSDGKKMFHYNTFNYSWVKHISSEKKKHPKIHPWNGGCFLDSDQNNSLKRGDKLGKSRYDKSVTWKINRCLGKMLIFKAENHTHTHNEKVISCFKLSIYCFIERSEPLYFVSTSNWRLWILELNKYFILLERHQNWCIWFWMDIRPRRHIFEFYWTINR